MMQAFRNAAKPVVVVLMVAFVGWLVFDLSGLSGGGGLLTQTSVGKIDGRSIEARVYQEAVQAAIDNQQRSSGATIGIEGVAMARDQVWEQFITSTLLEREYRRRGIRTSTAEIAEAIRNFPPPEFQQNAEMMTDGVFDLAKYQRWLASAVGQQYIPLLEGRYRDEIQRAKLFRALVADVGVSERALWERFQDENEQVRVGVLRFNPATSVPASEGEVSSTEVDSYYRANRESFRRTRQAWLSYVSIPRLPIASDTAAALARAVAIREEIVNGAPFAEVATRESSDQVSAAQGGDLGEWTRGQFDPDFQAAADRLPLNTVSEPVRSAFGYHIIQMTERDGDRFRARHILIPIEVSGEHRERLDAQADSLESIAADRLDGTALDSVARALNLRVEAAGVIAENQQVVAANMAVPDAGVWAFQAEEGETSPVIEAPGAYFVFRVDSLQAEGVPPLAAIRAEVEAAARAAKLVQATARVADEIRREVEAGQALAGIAQARGLDYTEPGSFTRFAPLVQGPELTGAAFGLMPGQVSAVITAQNTVWLLQGLERVPADSARFAAELPTLRQTLLRELRNRRIQDYLASLRANARIVDRRAALYRTEAQLEAQAVAQPIF